MDYKELSTRSKWAVIRGYTFLTLYGIMSLVFTIQFVRLSYAYFIGRINLEHCLYGNRFFITTLLVSPLIVTESVKHLKRAWKNDL